MFKQNFTFLVNIIVNPPKAWDLLKEQSKTHAQFLNGYFFPLIGFVALVVFTGSLFYNYADGRLDYALAVKSATLFLFTIFASFYLASFLLNDMMPRFFKLEKNMDTVQQMIAGTMTIDILTIMLRSIWPNMFFFRFIPLYMLVVIWSASETFIPVPTNRRPLFLFIAFILIMASHVAIEWIIQRMVPGV